MLLIFAHTKDNFIINILKMLTGANFIGNTKSKLSENGFHAINAKTGENLKDIFYPAVHEEIEQAVEMASKSFFEFQQISQKDRANFLNAIADEIVNLGDDLLQRASIESALPITRFKSERERTVNQLRMFADLLKDGSWVNASIDTALPNREPIPKPDLRKIYTAVGPVVVFGASNFPLAYSTAGGDTASALAAGCPVIVKSHPAHPGTGEMVAGAILLAAQNTNMPEGVFSNLNDSGYAVGTALVTHPKIKAVGFTGSQSGGRALMDMAAKRPEPIPVYAEMGSINPILLLNDALKNRNKEIAKSYAVSLTAGVGQFCTNPGLMIGIQGEYLDKFIKSLVGNIQEVLPAKMLTSGIALAYSNGLEKVLAQKNVTLEGTSNNDGNDLPGRPLVASVRGESFITNPKLSEEIFGPFSLIVKCVDQSELDDVVEQLGGQLTASVIGEEKEVLDYEPIIRKLANKVGRLIFNGVPTGVEVCPSMNHGGMYPATSDAKFTAVGIDAIYRFVRPISYQNWPNHFLPDELKNENPLQISRRVNGKQTKAEI